MFLIEMQIQFIESLMKFKTWIIYQNLSKVADNCGNFIFLPPEDWWQNFQTARLEKTVNLRHSNSRSVRTKTPKSSSSSSSSLKASKKTGQSDHLKFKLNSFSSHSVCLLLPVSAPNLMDINFTTHFWSLERAKTWNWNHIKSRKKKLKIQK